MEAAPEEFRTHMVPLREQFQELLDGLCGGSDKWLPTKPYYVDFISSRSINAVALSTPRLDCIGINYGLWFALQALGPILFSVPTFLQSVGNSQCGQDHLGARQHLETLRHLIRNGELASGLRYDNPLPSCPIRIRAAALLTKMAIEFIFHHELAHIHAGHLDFLAETTGHHELVELGADRIGRLSSATSRALEIGADSWACAAFTAYADPDVTDRREVFVSESDYLTAWLVAVGAVFRLFAHEASNQSEWTTHPHPYIRLAFAVDMLHQKSKNEIFLQRAQIETAFAQAEEELDEVWRQAGLRSLVPEDVADPDAEIGQLCHDVNRLNERLQSRPKPLAE